jgi:hypothetical protein
MPWRRMGEWRYSSSFLDFGTRWRWVVQKVLNIFKLPGGHFMGQVSLATCTIYRYIALSMNLYKKERDCAIVSPHRTKLFWTSSDFNVVQSVVYRFAKLYHLLSHFSLRLLNKLLELRSFTSSNKTQIEAKSEQTANMTFVISHDSVRHNYPH